MSIRPITVTPDTGTREAAAEMLKRRYATYRSASAASSSVWSRYETC